MIKLTMEQRSPEWLAARVGIPTASGFDRIITKTGKPSTAAQGYIEELVAEYFCGGTFDDVTSDWMQRGVDMEEAAVAFYELQRDVETEAVGFCMRDDGLVGCSPDRLVGEDGGLEIKCPSPKIHVHYLIGSPAEAYRAQIQGCLYVTGRQWWDILSFHPNLPPALVRCERDEEYIKTLADLLDEFVEKLADSKLKIERMKNAVPE